MNRLFAKLLAIAPALALPAMSLHAIVSVSFIKDSDVIVTLEEVL